MEYAAMNISQKEWDAVSDLIEDVQNDQERDEFIKSFVEWRFAVRKFRTVETNRMILSEPNETDFRCRAICLHSLLAMGEALVLWSHDFRAGAFIAIRITHEDIAACVEELQQSLREWHNGFTAAESQAAQSVIFGGQA